MRLRRLLSSDGSPAGYIHWCPGCDAPHGIWVDKPSPFRGAQWKFDGNIQAPTFSPSIRCFYTRPDKVEVTTCHYFIKAGNVEFCGDCQHELSGKTVPLPDMPQWANEEERNMAKNEKPEGPAVEEQTQEQPQPEGGAQDANVDEVEQPMAGDTAIRAAHARIDALEATVKALRAELRHFLPLPE